jgi:hypothetical protein
VNKRIQVQQGVREVRDRENSEVPGERECKREKNDGETQMWERGAREKVLGGRRGEKVQDVLRGEETMELIRMDAVK